MFDSQSFTYKKKLIATAVVTGLFVILIFRNFVNPSISAKNEIEAVREEIEDIRQLMRSASNREDRFSTSHIARIDQKRILEFLNHTSKSIPGITIDEISDIHIYKTENKLAIETYRYDLKGTYKGIVELLDSIYFTYPGTLRAIHFNSVKPSYNADKELHAQLFFQKNY